MKIKYVILLHILVWTLVFVSDAVTVYMANPYAVAGHPFSITLFSKFLLIAFGYMLIGASTFYETCFWVGPQLFIKKNYLKAVIYALLVLGGMVILRYTIEYGFFLPVLHFDNYRGNHWTIGHFIKNAVFYYLPREFAYGLIYFVVQEWQANNRKRQELQQEKLSAELAFLRSQINPHFIFNTINDIYALTYQKSEQAPEALLKLSEILRYMLREGQQDLVDLSQEVAYLKNVIELQQIGAKGNAFINFRTEGSIAGQRIASLIFIAFVENAFKHGVWNDPEHPLLIRIRAGADVVTLQVRNRIGAHLKDRTGGIGLVNVRRRLELIYPGKHRLEIAEEDDYYTVNLQLEL